MRNRVILGASLICAAIFLVFTAGWADHLEAWRWYRSPLFMVSAVGGMICGFCGVGLTVASVAAILETAERGK